MRKIRILALTLMLAVILPIRYAQAQTGKDEVIFGAMQDELERNKEQLFLADFGKPFIISYMFGESRQFDVVGCLGVVTRSFAMPSSVGGIRILLGDYHRMSDSRYAGKFQYTGMPLEPDYNLIRRLFWMGSDGVYKGSLRDMAWKNAYLKANPKSAEEERLADLTKVSPVTKIVADDTKYEFDRKQWEQNIRELSAIFKDYKNLQNSSVGISGMEMTVYNKTSEGVTYKQPLNLVRLYAQAAVMTDDGVRFGDSYMEVAQTPLGLPSMDELKKRITEFAENLSKLRDVEPITEYYSGPVLFEDMACARIFTDNLLNQEGLFAYRRPEGGAVKRTLEGRIGKKIVDNRITIKNYSTLNKYSNTPLLGAYEIDAEGVVPPKELTLVEAGLLKNLLNGRVPTLKTPQSTGSSRLVVSRNIEYVTAPGTIHIQVKDGTKQEKMKNALLKAAREEGLDYAYIVCKMAGQASRIYKVNVKDGAETMVRTGDFSRIDLAKIKRLRNISSKENVMNYMLGQQVLSSLIYPSSILIEDVEINKSELKNQKKPALEFPLQRTANK